MSDSESDAQVDLTEIFPNLTPVNGSPTLWTVNGVGLSVYGKRDYHAATDSYIKTYCFCVVFIPILALSAYRVVDSQEGGWYFLGKEPLSKFAKTWNFGPLLAALLAFSVASWSTDTRRYTPRAQSKSPSAAQRSSFYRDIDSAALLATTEQWVASAGLYQKLSKQKLTSGNRKLVVDGMNELIHGRLIYAPPSVASKVFEIALDVFQRGNRPDLVNRVVAKARTMSTHVSTQNPKGGLMMLDTVMPYASASRRRGLNAQRQDLLNRISGKKPGRMSTVAATPKSPVQPRTTPTRPTVRTPVTSTRRPTTASSTPDEAGFRAGILDIAGVGVDAVGSQSDVDVKLLRFLYDDTATRDRYVKQFAAHPKVSGSIDSFDRALARSPKNAHLYSQLLGAISFTADASRIAKLAGQLSGADLDLADQIREAQKVYHGQVVSTKAGRGRVELRKSEQLVASARSRGGLRLAVAAAQRVELQMMLAQHGLVVDGDALVKLAEDAMAAKASVATRRMLAKALLFRADQSIRKSQPTYDLFSRANQRAIESSYVVLLALGDGKGAMANAILADPDVQRAATLEASVATRLPMESGPWSWALLRVTNSAAAASVAYYARTHPHTSRVLKMWGKIQSYDTETAVRVYWSHLMRKDASGALKAASEFRNRGVPVPTDLR